MPIIEVEHVTKEYQLGTITGLKDSIANAFRRLTGRPGIQRERFKALDDVSFTVEEGEVVGIIGHNGSGKSTLLKILARVTTPTSGKASVRGSIAPLIEVGAGINPELTGRENIYLNASILGIPKQVIRKKIDEIIEFSELEQFIDTQVKRYSSGMQVKLGFAIATSLDAEILIIDEVLAVGDLAFQRKCFDRMEELIKHQGKTVLVVSHNLRQIQRLCKRVILLDHGQIIQDGDEVSVCNTFYDLNERKIQQKINTRIQASDEVEIIDISLTTPDGKEIEQIYFQSDIVIKIKIKANTYLRKPVFSIGIHTTDFLYLATHGNQVAKELPPGVHIIQCLIKCFPLLPKGYSLRLGIDVEDFGRTIFYGENLKHIQVVQPGVNKLFTSEGFIKLDCEWYVAKPIPAPEIANAASTV